MENSELITHRAPGLLGILTHSLTIVFMNPKFTIFIFKISVPLFCALSLYEAVFQQILIQIPKLVEKTIESSQNAYENFDKDYEEMISWEKLIGKVSKHLLLLCLMYIGFLHFLELINTIAIVSVSSEIYKGQKAMNLKDMFGRFINETRLKGPLITSIYVLLLASLILFGIVFLSPYIYVTLAINFFMLPFLEICIVLLAKYVEWSATWNMGIVISILEEKQGDVALIVSSYISRGCRLCGFGLMLILFILRVGLRLASLFARWGTGGLGALGITVYVGLVCLVNVLKWVMFMVYFFECKKLSLEGEVQSESSAVP